MSEEEFINRRGHAVSEVKAAVETLPEPDIKQPAKPTVTRRKRKRLRLSATQKKYIFIALAVLVAVPFLVGEYAHMTYEGEVSQAKKEISALFSSVKTEQTKAMSSKTLTDADKKLGEIRDKLCAGGMLDNIAGLYPRSKTAFEACNTYRSGIATLEDNVNVAAAQMTYLERLQTILSGVTEPLKDQFAVFASQQELWQTCVTSLEQMTVPKTFTDAHKAMLEQATTIRGQWITITQAANVTDAAKFNTARAKLTTAYAAFRDSSNGFSASISANQQALLKAAQGL